MTTPLHRQANPSRTLALHPSAGIHLNRLLVACLLSAAPLALPAPAMAQAPGSATSAPAQTSYRIAAGPLAPALNQFGAAAGVTIQFDPALTTGLNTAGLEGHYTVGDGFAVLLQNSGLMAVSRGDGVYVLEKVGGDGSTMLPTVRVRDGILGSTTEDTGSYRAQYTNTATKLNLSPRETPQTVTVVTRQQMDDFGIT